LCDPYRSTKYSPWKAIAVPARETAASALTRFDVCVSDREMGVAVIRRTNAGRSTGDFPGHFFIEHSVPLDGFVARYACKPKTASDYSPREANHRFQLAFHNGEHVREDASHFFSFASTPLSPRNSVSSPPSSIRLSFCVGGLYNLDNRSHFTHVSFAI